MSKIDEKAWKAARDIAISWLVPASSALAIIEAYEAAKQPVDIEAGAVDEELLGNLANVLIETFVRHIHSGATPLRTALCQQLRNALPWFYPTVAKSQPQKAGNDE